MLYLLGAFISCTMIFNFFLKFDKKKTKKSILITSFITLIFISLVSTMGNFDEDKYIMNLQLFINLFIGSLVVCILPLIIAIFVSLKEKSYNSKFVFYCGVIWVLILSLMTLLKILMIIL